MASAFDNLLGVTPSDSQKPKRSTVLPQPIPEEEGRFVDAMTGEAFQGPKPIEEKNETEKKIDQEVVPPENKAIETVSGPSAFDNLLGPSKDGENEKTESKVSAFDSLLGSSTPSDKEGSTEKVAPLPEPTDEDQFWQGVTGGMEVTPSGKPARHENGRPTEDYFKEVELKKSMLPGVVEGVKGLGKIALEAGKEASKLNLRQASTTVGESALSGVQGTTDLAGMARGQVVDKLGRIIGAGEEWETKREYDRWMETLEEAKRREVEKKSRLGDVYRTIGADEAAKEADRDANQRVADVGGIVLDPTVYASGGATAGAKVLTKAALNTGKKLLGAERAMKMANLAEKITVAGTKASNEIAKVPVLGKTMNVVKEVAKVPFKPLEQLTKTGATTLPYAGKAIEFAGKQIEKHPVLTALAISGGAGKAVSELTGSSEAGWGTAGGGAVLAALMGEKPALGARLIRTGQRIETTGDLFGGVAKSMELDAGISKGFREGEKVVNQPVNKRIMKSALGEKFVEGLTKKDRAIGALARGTQWASKNVASPLATGATVGYLIGEGLGLTPQETGMLTGQGLVFGQIGHGVVKGLEKAGIIESPEMHNYVSAKIGDLSDANRNVLSAGLKDGTINMKTAASILQHNDTFKDVVDMHLVGPEEFKKILMEHSSKEGANPLTPEQIANLDKLANNSGVFLLNDKVSWAKPKVIYNVNQFSKYTTGHESGHIYDMLSTLFGKKNDETAELLFEGRSRLSRSLFGDIAEGETGDISVGQKVPGHLDLREWFPAINEHTHLW